MYSTREKLDEVVREIKMRERVFSRLCNVGSKSIQEAQKQIAIMTEIADDYRRALKEEQLFNETTIPAPRSKADRRDSRSPRDARPDRAGETTEQPPAASPAQTDQG